MKKFVSLLLVLILSLSLVIGMPFSVGASQYVPYFVDLSGFQFLSVYRDFKGLEKDEQKQFERENPEYNWSESYFLEILFRDIEDFETFPMLYLPPESGYQLVRATFADEHHDYITYDYKSVTDASLVRIWAFLPEEDFVLTTRDFIIEDSGFFSGGSAEGVRNEIGSPLPRYFGEITIAGQPVALYRRYTGDLYAYIDSKEWNGSYFGVKFLGGNNQKDLDPLRLEQLKVTSLAQFERGEFTEFYSLPTLESSRVEYFINERRFDRLKIFLSKLPNVFWVSIPLIPVFVGIGNFCVRRFKKKKSTPTE